MSEPSGVQWCLRYATSTALSDLIEPFQSNATQCIAALRAGGASVIISATYRPAERAFLMHWAWAIARGLPLSMCPAWAQPGVPVDPAKVPGMPLLGIDWTCGNDEAAARVAARAMVAAYGMAFVAALVSRHTQRRAVDMTIRVPDGAVVMDAAGAPNVFHGVGNEVDSRVVAIAKTYGLLKIIGPAGKIEDAPHFSDDGR